MISEILRSVYLNARNKKLAKRSGKSAVKKDFFASTKRRFRVGLRDIDFNLHINNARYMVFMERARWDHPVQTHTWDGMMKNKLNFIVAGIEMGYIREIRWFKRFEVDTRYLGWDDKYFYIEQRFIADGKIHAYGLVKAVFMQKGKLATPQSVAQQLNIGQPPEALPGHINQWQAMAISKRAYSTNPRIVSPSKPAADDLSKSA